MVTVHFRLTDAEPLQLGMDQPQPLHVILNRCRAELDEEFGSVIVICRGKVLRHSDPVNPGDTLEVFPAISGG